MAMVPLNPPALALVFQPARVSRGYLTPAFCVKEAVPPEVVGPCRWPPVVGPVRFKNPLALPQATFNVSMLVAVSNEMPAPTSPPLPGVPLIVPFSLPLSNPVPALPIRSNNTVAAGAGRARQIRAAARRSFFISRRGLKGGEG